MEARYAANLDWLIEAGEIESWTPQHKFDLRVNGEHVCNYYIDFKVVFADGSIEYHEVKGAETRLWRLKWRLTQILHPDLKLVLIK